MFSYSERPNTTASEFAQKIDPYIKAERSKRLHKLSVQKRCDFYHSIIGKTIPVLFESINSDGSISGLTEEYIRVDVKSDLHLTNKILDVTIQEASTERCIGLITKPHITSAIRIAI
jgi:threonylcarbamoyladenosine tRNA methylthiotransferase MtaB